MKNIVNEITDAGTYSIKWDASDLPSGIYLITLSTGTYSQTKKALLLK
ncbi:MAG: T9SS type A sorting domain-containing protein [Candidatus Marinimicrobia bacterium]|nr:T9SS type A sorting domain-containing protein [Candidatus Neomarinimicrobiota bacterium]